MSQGSNSEPAPVVMPSPHQVEVNGDKEVPGEKATGWLPASGSSSSGVPFELDPPIPPPGGMGCHFALRKVLAQWTRTHPAPGGRRPRRRSRRRRGAAPGPRICTQAHTVKPHTNEGNAIIGAFLRMKNNCGEKKRGKKRLKQNIELDWSSPATRFATFWPPRLPFLSLAPKDREG